MTTFYEDTPNGWNPTKLQSGDTITIICREGKLHIYFARGDRRLSTTYYNPQDVDTVLSVDTTGEINLLQLATVLAMVSGGDIKPANERYPGYQKVWIS